MSDLYLYPQNGIDTDIELKPNGDPKLTGGLDTAVYLSLFTPPWWGNSISSQAERYTSTIPELYGQPLTNQTRLSVIAAARDSLQWLLDEGIAGEIEIEAEIPKAGNLYVSVTIHETGREAETTLAYGVNWDEQEAILV